MSTNYEKFVAANHALLTCMSSVPVEEFKAMTPADQDKVCCAESLAVKDMLSSGNLSFGAILNERLASLKSQQ